MTTPSACLAAPRDLRSLSLTSVIAFIKLPTFCVRLSMDRSTPALQKLPVRRPSEAVEYRFDSNGACGVVISPNVNCRGSDSSIVGT